MEDDKRTSAKVEEGETQDVKENGQVPQPERSISSEFDLPSEQSSRRPFTSLSQEDSDMALARALQEQVGRMARHVMDTAQEEKEVEDQSPIEEVALVVPVTDDPSLPVFTFRVWVLGFISCVLIMFLNTFYTYRTQPLTISAILAQILALTLGKFMAAILPTRKMHVPFIGWEYSLNPGPFNMKEHVLITIFANNAVSSGGGDAYSIGAINVMKAYYKQNLSFIVALIIVLTTQILGYGWAGLLRKYLVEPADMWWPSNLAQVSLFRSLKARGNQFSQPQW